MYFAKNNKITKTNLSLLGSALCASILLSMNIGTQQVKADTIVSGNTLSTYSQPVSTKGDVDSNVNQGNINNDKDNVNTNSSVQSSDSHAAHATQPTSNHTTNMIKSATSKATPKNITKSNNINSKQDKSWDNVDANYDSANHILTINGGSLTDPNAIYKQYADAAQSLQKIKITKELTLAGNIGEFFSNLPNLTDIEGSDLIKVDKVTNMSSLFKNDISLTKLDLSTWNTTQTNNMGRMFQNNKLLSKIRIPGGPDLDDGMIQLSSLSTENLKDISYMFDGCDSIITFGGFPLGSVEQATHFMSNCANLQAINFGSGLHCTTSNITDYSYMFADNPKLTKFDGVGMSALPSDPVGYAQSSTMNHMFANDVSLKYASWGVVSNVTDVSYLFAGCKSLIVDDLSFISNPSISKITNFAHMLDGCSSMTVLDLGMFTTNDKSNPDKTDMFHGMTNVQKMILSPTINLAGTGFNAPFDYTAIGTGTIDKPKGKKYSASKLVQFWNNQKSGETFIASPAKKYQITINYIDLVSHKIIKSDVQMGNANEPILYKQILANAIADLDKLGYVYDANTNQLPLNNNGDIQLPDDIDTDMTYTIGFKPKKNTDSPGSDDVIVTNVIAHYQDTSGKQLLPDKFITGKVGSSWLAEPELIAGYHLSRVIGMATGTISNVRQEVTFVYIKDQVVAPDKPIVPDKPQPHIPNKPNNSHKSDQGNTARHHKQNNTSNKINNHIILSNDINSRQLVDNNTMANTNYQKQTFKNKENTIPQTGVSVTRKGNFWLGLGALIIGLGGLIIGLLKKRHAS